MTEEEKIICKQFLNDADKTHSCNEYKMLMALLEQEPRKDEVILTNKEYRELIANEYDNGYCKGYAVALEEQEHILDKIKEEIKDNTYFINETTEKEGIDFETVEKIIDKYREVEE